MSATFLHKNAFHITILGVVLLLSTTACKKTLPPSVVGEPALVFSGTIDGQATTIEAGEDAIQLNASFLRDGVGVDKYTGEFSPISCTGCPGSLRISLRGKEMRDGNTSAQPETDLALGFHEFVGGVASQADPKAFRFRAISQGKHPMKHEWIIEGDTLVGQDAPYKRFENTGHQPVILRTTDASGCQSQTEYRVPAGQGFCGDPFRFDYNKMGNGKVHFHAPVSVDPEDIQAVSWNFGDGGFAISDLQPTYTYPRPGIYPVKVIIVDKGGCLHCDFQNVYSEPGNTCTSSILAMAVAPDGEVGKVTVQWWNSEGKEFNSDHIEGQPTSSLFEIISAEPFENDPDGTPTWKVEAQVRCILFATDGSDEQIEFVSEQLVFALGTE